MRRDEASRRRRPRSRLTLQSPPVRAFAFLGLLSLCSCAGACEPVLGPEGEIAHFLETQRGGTTIAIAGGGTLALSSLKFDRLLVKPEGDGFTAVATFDAEGIYDGQTRVSYLGLERAPFVRRDGHWVPRTSPVPALEEIVGLLAARRAAIAKGDASALEPLVAKGFQDPRLSREAALAQARERASQPATTSAVAWIVRVERDGAQVSEESESPGADGKPRKSQARFDLKREDGRLKIFAGLP